jgi:hypothetical protein
MTYDPIDTNETDNNADGKLTIDDLTATVVAGLDTSSGTENVQIFTDGEGGLTARGYENVSVSQLPVAYSNLIAWYPFDADTYEGFNAHDVTATLGGSGDDTAFDGTVNGATYQSNGGVTDINAGPNSGAFDFDGSNDFISTSSSDNLSPTPITVMGWINADSTSSNEGGFGKWNRSGSTGDASYLIRTDVGTDTYEINIQNEDGSSIAGGGVGTLNANTWDHLAFSHDGSSLRRYFNGSFEFETTENYNIGSSNIPLRFGLHDVNGFLDGQLDDIRIYNTILSDSEINDIYNSTEP